LKKDLEKATDKRMFAVAKALYTGKISSSSYSNGGTIQQKEFTSATTGDNNGAVQPQLQLINCIHALTGIDRWFLHRMAAIIDAYRRLESLSSIDALPLGGLLLQVFKIYYLLFI
jgi:hypothetical protein